MKTEIYTLNQLGTVSRGKSKHRPRNDAILYGGKYPFIQTGDIKHSSMYITEYSQTYNETGLAQSKLWDEDTLCITIAANIAETAILKIKACFPDSIVGFIANKEKADVRFVKYYFDIYKLYMQNISKGTTQDNFSLEKMLRVKFNIPSLSIQQKIANILSRYDEAIENNNKRIKLLEQMAQNLYKEWFVRFRFPGWQNVEFENGIPKGWKVVRLRDIAKDVGKSITKNEINYANDVYIPIDCIPNHQMALTEVSDIENAESSLQRFEKNDIIFGAMRVYFHKVILAPMNGVTRTTCFVINSKNKIMHNYLYSLLFSESTISYANTISVGATMPYVRWNDFIRMYCLLPPNEIVEKYNNIVEPIFKKILGSYEYNQNLAKQRDLLLPRLMSGKLEVE